MTQDELIQEVKAIMLSTDPENFGQVEAAAHTVVDIVKDWAILNTLSVIKKGVNSA